MNLGFHKSRDRLDHLNKRRRLKEGSVPCREFIYLKILQSLDFTQEPRVMPMLRIFKYPYTTDKTKTKKHKTINLPVLLNRCETLSLNTKGRT